MHQHHDHKYILKNLKLNYTLTLKQTTLIEIFHFLNLHKLEVNKVGKNMIIPFSYQSIQQSRALQIYMERLEKLLILEYIPINRTNLDRNSFYGYLQREMKKQVFKRNLNKILMNISENSITFLAGGLAKNLFMLAVNENTTENLNIQWSKLKPGIKQRIVLTGSGVIGVTAIAILALCVSQSSGRGGVVIPRTRRLVLPEIGLNIEVADSFC